MRCFVAVEIDEKVRGEVAKVSAEMRKRLGPKLRGVTWVRPEAMHLTLKFLGEVPDAQAVEVCRRVQEVAGRHSPFFLEAAGCGTFGRPPQVVWTGFRESPELAALQEDIEKALAEVGFEPEARKFSGHLTLCRIKSPRAGREIQAAVESFRDRCFGEFEVDAVCVFKSELTKQGPLYTLLGSGPLGRK